MPIGLRLTLWYTLALAVCLIVLSWLVYSLQKSSLANAVEDDLEERIALLATLITVDDSGRPQLTFDSSDDNLNDTYYRLFDRSGNVISDSSSAYGDVPPIPNAVTRSISENNDIFSSVPGRDGGTFLLTEPVQRDGNVVAVLQVGQSREEYVEALASLSSVLLTIVPIALLVTAGLGWLISYLALRPVNKVTAMAREISGGDLSRRLNLDLADDEVGRLARTFDEMIERLDGMVQRQRQFTADASHELRTPLTAIRGQVDVALQQPRDAQGYQTTLAFINDQIARMTRLVEALLVLARSESGALRLELERVDVGLMVESAREIALPQAAAKGLRLRLAPGPAAAVNGDEALLIQLLLNLIDNGIRYTESGEVAVGWEVTRGNVEVIVQDTGPGIPPELQERIFEPFYRVDPSRSNERGAGLGLSIARTIAAAHGGTIRVSSDRYGAIFVVALPIAAVTQPSPTVVRTDSVPATS